MIVCTDLTKSYKHGSSEKLVLDKVNLQVAPGERLAVLGRNGAGKTTLIKLIGGVEKPNSGRVTRTMSLSWPLGFTGGFQGSLTGMDNARFISRIYNRNFADIRDQVEDFSELGRQLKMPVKTYSAGMRARLAFALSLAVEFDCYLIDEVILVGDQNFHQKCLHELFEKRADRAMILASHSLEMIHTYCTRAVVIDQGRVTEYDNVQAALDVYIGL